jgi:hypothetical protein
MCLPSPHNPENAQHLANLQAILERFEAQRHAEEASHHGR